MTKYSGKIALEDSVAGDREHGAAVDPTARERRRDGPVLDDHLRDPGHQLLLRRHGPCVPGERVPVPWVVSK